MMINLELLKKEMEVARINLPLKTKSGGREKELVPICRSWQFKRRKARRTWRHMAGLIAGAPTISTLNRCG
eukprot:3644999-Ditylum_brightwellii.AAC.1